MFDWLVGLGVLGLFAIVILIFLLPFIATVLVGTAIASMFGFTGIIWWAFIILFYILISSIIGACTRIAQN